MTDNKGLDMNKYDSKVAQDIEAAGNLFQRVDEKLLIIMLTLGFFSLVCYLVLR